MALNPKFGQISNNNLSVHNFDGKNSQLDELEEYIRVMQTAGKVAIYVSILHIIIVIIGFFANILVICRIIKFAKINPEKFKGGIGILLLVMAIADLISLFMITSQHGLVMYPIEKAAIKMSLCKVHIFSTHVTPSISIWSWVLMSYVRYMAIQHPMMHMHTWNVPKRAIAFILSMSSLTSIWLLFAVENGEKMCIQVALFGTFFTNRIAQLIEIGWSFCVPAVLISYMDVSVMLTSSFAIRIWLTMAFIGLIFNAPESIYRIIILIGVDVGIPTHYHYCMQMIFQLLYFAQFAFNAWYLATFVYDKSIRPTSPRNRAMMMSKTNSVGQFVSYRSASPVNDD